LTQGAQQKILLDLDLDKEEEEEEEEEEEKKKNEKKNKNGKKEEKKKHEDEKEEEKEKKKKEKKQKKDNGTHPSTTMFYNYLIFFILGRSQAYAWTKEGHEILEEDEAEAGRVHKASRDPYNNHVGKVFFEPHLNSVGRTCSVCNKKIEETTDDGRLFLVELQKHNNRKHVGRYYFHANHVRLLLIYT
jgi:hypothetical protein